MKRSLLLCTFGAALVAAVHYLFPGSILEFHAWRKDRKIEQNRGRLSQLPTPSSGVMQPGLGFLQDLDRVRFIYARSFDDEIEITIQRPFFRREDPIMLHAVIWRRTRENRTAVRSFEKPVPPEVFAEIIDYILRRDVLANSLHAPEAGLDGSAWLLEGTKGNFTIEHQRWCAIDYDPEFAAIGKRFLDLAEIKLSDKDAY